MYLFILPEVNLSEPKLENPRGTIRAAHVDHILHDERQQKSFQFEMYLWLSGADCSQWHSVLVSTTFQIQPGGLGQLNYSKLSLARREKKCDNLISNI